MICALAGQTKQQWTHSFSCLCVIPAGELPVCEVTGPTIKDCMFHNPAQDLARYCNPGVTSCERHQEFQDLWNRWAAAYDCPSVLQSSSRQAIVVTMSAWCQCVPEQRRMFAQICSECLRSFSVLW